MKAEENPGGVRSETKNIYICEKCRSEYLSSEEALKCEESHVKPVEIAGYKYHAMQPLGLVHLNFSPSPDGAYPFEVVLRFSDGTYRSYWHY
ncbi:MAG: hypothetical protein QXS27_03745 [Candidatus Jordarchaeaceae archaeon]